jgi:hypothetical protein
MCSYIATRMLYLEVPRFLIRIESVEWLNQKIKQQWADRTTITTTGNKPKQQRLLLQLAIIPIHRLVFNLDETKLSDLQHNDPLM